MNSKRLIKKLSSENVFLDNLNNIILSMKLFDDTIDLIEIPYNNIKDSEIFTFIINQELYEKLLYLNKSYILLGKTGSFSGQNYIYINDAVSSFNKLPEENIYDTCILYQERENNLDTTLEQDNLIQHINENRNVLNLRENGMNLTFGDIKDLINFNNKFYGKYIKTFKLIKNDNELNIIYSDNNVIKGIINIYVSDNNFKEFIPVATYFKKVGNSKIYKKGRSDTNE